MKKDCIRHFELEPYVRFLHPDETILDINTSGRYWRSSQLLELHLMCIKDGQATEYIAVSEKESDEYDMLLLLSESISSFDTVITFNGNAFDLPHLKHKYDAYALPDPFLKKAFRDLFSEYREYAHLLGLPSRKLDDYAAYAGAPIASSDAVKTLYTLSLDSLTSLFDGNWKLIHSASEDGYLYYTLSVDLPFPKRISLHDQIYHMIAENREIRLSVKITDGKIRKYYTDIKNYVYLPLEGFAIHKSMASFVEKSHKEKAVRENCFSLVAYSDRFLNDTELIRSYISSVLQYLHSR